MRDDAHLPEAPDLEELWQKVGESYLPDAIREFAKYCKKFSHNIRRPQI